MKSGKCRHRHFPGTGVLIALATALAADAPGAAAAQPDLVIESISHAPAAPARGDTVTFTVTVRNQGDVSAGVFYVAFYFDSATEPTTSGNGDEGVTIYDLPAGAAIALEFASPAPLDAGVFKAWAYVDPHERVMESNESNNAGPVGGCDWSVTPSPEPDLFIESMTCSPSSSAPGDSVTFTVTVTNVGGSDAGAFNVGFWSDLSSPPGSSDAFEDDLDVAGLAAGNSTSLDFVLTAPTAGDYRAHAYADRRAGGEVAESNETNNLASCKWYVIIPDAYEDDDDFTTATPISDGDCQYHSLHHDDDVDYMVFSLSVPGGIAVMLRNNPDWENTRITLYDGLYTSVRTNLEYWLRSSELSPGTYYLKVQSGYDGSPVDEYVIDLVIAEKDAFEPDDTFAEASSIPLGVAQERSLHRQTDGCSAGGNGGGGAAACWLACLAAAALIASRRRARASHS